MTRSTLAFPFRSTVVVALTLVVGCGDPVRSSRQDELGPEVSGIPTGPGHRAGQPCLVCHNGGTAPEFAVAGTLYRTSGARDAAYGGVVTLTDARGTVHQSTANGVGNFYVPAGDFDPTYPLRVSVTYGGTCVPMKSLVQREGSCSACHLDPAGTASVGHVYVEGVTPTLGEKCP